MAGGKVAVQIRGTSHFRGNAEITTTHLDRQCRDEIMGESFRGFGDDEEVIDNRTEEQTKLLLGSRMNPI